MEPNLAVPFVVQLDDCDDPTDVIEMLVLGRFVAGIEPAARTVRLSRLRPDALLRPPDVEPTRTAVDGGRRSQLVQGDGWTLRSQRWSDRSGHVVVTAATDALAEQIVLASIAGAVEQVDDDDAFSTVSFWHRRRDGGLRRVERDIVAKPWESIRGNYTGSAAAAIDEVVGYTAGDCVGRLLLLHGPPGTGKTTVMRAIAQAWRTWCDIDIVLDPEHLFADPSYLMEVALGERDELTDDDRWRLLVMEDCDELVRADAKKDVGQSLSRLLNLTDGILGQGLRVLVALTTNEPIHALHPAIVRPGRCLAEVGVGPLTQDEARSWLGEIPCSISANGATLAELFILKGELHKVVEHLAPERSGQYL